MRKKVYVGMSGGVDSSVSAVLLKRDGYDVTGVFIKVWQPDFIECTWKEDRLDAMRVAAHLDIPFITLDLEKEYKEEVIDYMIEEYKVGRTPNPDVMCNKFVKFGGFFTWAMAQGADYIATGHYAKHNGVSLVKSEDENKDQTYFLWTLPKEIIPHVLFPIGDIEKPRVRELAREAGLPVAEKKDSQGLCFVGTIDVKTLLKEYIDEKKGNVVNEEGEVIGTHDGVTFYTIGERHGFVITKKSAEEKPYFVIAKDIENNTLTVSHTKKEERAGELITLVKVNWTVEVVKGNIYEGRGRYRAPLSQLEAIDSKTFKVIAGEVSVAKGQSLVLYDKDVCIGGGVIN
ncbi:MAG: tRNA 2-thiouridine(34) synthase MnmA [Candidatus Pacebacteria bacterium]|nr:tRNA 2-thiouridine(34) synthase MnmA [Candidatus Paceibacterota bacterium]